MEDPDGPGGGGHPVTLDSPPTRDLGDSGGRYQLANSHTIPPATEAARSIHQTLIPRDKGHRIYFGFVLAGVGFLLPYNSFIVAVDYFQVKYGPGSTIIFDMSLTYILAAFGAVLLNNVLVDKLSLNTRICFGYLISFGTLTSVALFEVWLDIFPKSQGSRIVLFAIAFLAVGCTVQQSSFYGYTSMLPSRYTQAVMTGESAAGFIVSVNRIFTKDLISNVKVNTIYFFSISIAIVLACYFTHRAVQDSDFVQFYINKCERSKNALGQRGNRDVQRAPQGTGATRRSSNSGPQSEEATTSSQEENCLPEFGESCRLGNQGSNFTNTVITFKGRSVSVKNVFLKIRSGLKARLEISARIWPHMLAIALAYFVTLCLFPGIESEVKSCRFGSWMPVFMMAVFNFSDLVGKMLASYPYRWSSAELVLISLSRILLVPLMVLCAAPRYAPLIPGEFSAFTLSALLGVTNGVFGSVPMILAPSKVNEAQKEMAGNIMTLSYSAGLTIGSAMAYGLDSILGPPVARSCP